MTIVFLAALGVGGATVAGGIIGFALERIPKKFSELTLSLASGIMLAAAVWGLIIPAMGKGGAGETFVCALGILSGAAFIGFCQKLVPLFRFAAGEGFENGEADGVLTFVLAMTVHNLPEGLAAGLSLGSGDISGALAVAGGIALQNIPEGMAVIPPMLTLGIRKKRAFVLAASAGLSEVLGTFLGYRAVTAFSGILPFSLAFAGGAMVYVIADGMMPSDTLRGRAGSFAFTVGFCAMLLLNLIL